MTGRKQPCADLCSLVRELGERLRVLRKKAGLTQRQVARSMGMKGTAGQSYISQIENGYLSSGPPLHRALEYLRVCGCRFDSLLDILDRYTSRLPVIEEETSAQVLSAIEALPAAQKRRAFKYAVGLKHKARLAVKNEADAEARVRQALARAKSEVMQERLKKLFDAELDKMGIGWTDILGANLRSYGRHVFATLRRLRGARQAWRRRALERLDQWPLKYGLEPEPFRRIKTAAMRFFEELEQNEGIG